MYIICPFEPVLVYNLIKLFNAAAEHHVENFKTTIRITKSLDSENSIKIIGKKLPRHFTTAYRKFGENLFQLNLSDVRFYVNNQYLFSYNSLEVMLFTDKITNQDTIIIKRFIGDLSTVKDYSEKGIMFAKMYDPGLFRTFLTQI